jgi:DNA-binding response OmpR family regulator
VDVFSRNPRIEVKTASTGYEAGVLTESFKPDVMLLDFMLPDINGNVVCKSVRENAALAGTKIIIVSGVVKQKEIDELLAAGADDFVKKPFNIDELLQKVDDLLEL